MSALDPFISNPAHSVPSEYAGAISASNNAPFPDAGIAQLLELADCASTFCLPGSVDASAGVGPEPLLLPAPAAFFPDICELISYAQGGLFYPVSPRDAKSSLPSGESDLSVMLDSSRGETISSPPLFLTDPSFEFTQSVRERGGVA